MTWGFLRKRHSVIHKKKSFQEIAEYSLGGHGRFGNHLVRREIILNPYPLEEREKTGDWTRDNPRSILKAVAVTTRAKVFQQCDGKSLEKKVGVRFMRGFLFARKDRLIGNVDELRIRMESSRCFPIVDPTPFGKGVSSPPEIHWISGGTNEVPDLPRNPSPYSD